MKKVIVAVVLIAVVALGWLKLNTLQVDFASLRGETTTVRRGDLTIPVNATGTVKPEARHVIKSKASGEVIEIARQAGEMVAQGDLLIRLKQDDEMRTVNRAKADLTRAAAALEQAKIAKRLAETVSIDAANAQIVQILAQLDFAKIDYENVKGLTDDDNASRLEYERARTTFERLQGQHATALADLKKAEIAVETAEQEVKLAQAAHETTTNNLADAEERLKETEIRSPIDGMVSQVHVELGDVIQGGTSVVGGGTVLAVVSNVSSIYVETEVDEADIGTVVGLAPEYARPGREQSESSAAAAFAGGAEVRITVEAFREDEFVGRIHRIYPEPTKSSGVVTYIVDILITSDNRDKLLLGMAADVEFTAQSAEGVLLVPHDAIRKNDEGVLGVYIPLPPKEGETTAGKEFVKVRFGLDNGMDAEVIEGLDEGDEVYIKLPGKISRDDEEET